MSALINPGSDDLSRRVFSLIFNGVSRGLTEFMSLPDRDAVARAVYDELRDGGVALAMEDGLAKLARVNDALHAHDLPPADVKPLGWWCISGEDFLGYLRRAANGDDPDLIYAEAYANCEIERPGES